ncbi:LacI family DNA-binding transcriptional regulator [Oenococcus sp. UCMA 17063]|nr:LacI family DNA-binding transcriptional regulator [Oenococcus sp. UCMA 17063]
MEGNTATIRDVAKQAGVSASTVSRILNYDDTLSVSDETRRTVLEIVEKLQYKKKVKKNSSSNDKIAIIQWHSSKEEMNDLYYLQIQYGIENKALGMGIAVSTLSFSDLISVHMSRYNGIIAIGKFDDAEITELASFNLPLVFIGQNYLPYGYDSVQSDFISPISWIIRHFIENDIDKIGMIAGQEQTGTKHNTVYDPRAITFKKELSNLNIFNPDFMFEGSYGPDSGFKLMEQAINKLDKNLPSGFIIGSDSMAIGALKALKQHSINVPKRVSLISFNDVSIAKYADPSLSTIHVYTEIMGERAFNLLIERIHNSKKIPESIIIGSKFIKRESSI